jgi:prephenate dehydratase
MKGKKLLKFSKRIIAGKERKKKRAGNNRRAAYLCPPGTFSHEAAPSGETAPIAAKTAADLYGVKILAADIDGSPLNTTRFWIFGRGTPPAMERDKTTLLGTGDLKGVLSRLVNAKILILSIYERPAGKKSKLPSTSWT